MTTGTLSNLAVAGKGTLKGDKAVAEVAIGENRKLYQERNRAYLLIVGLFVLIVILSLALVTAFPLKQIEAVVVTVDTASGHVVKTQTASVDVLAANEAIILNEAHDYVVTRNTADNFDRQRLEDYIATHSTPDVDQQYRGDITIANNDSPYIKIGPRGRQTVKINSIALSDKNMAQVFFETYVWKDGVKAETKYWQANIRFTFTGTPKLGLDKRWINPLGYIVTNYSQNEQLAKPVTPYRAAALPTGE